MTARKVSAKAPASNLGNVPTIMDNGHGLFSAREMNCTFNTRSVFVSPPAEPNVIHGDTTNPGTNPGEE